MKTPNVPTEPFEPGPKPEVKAMLKKARKTNLRRDRIEKEAGFACPTGSPMDQWLRNCLSAFLCGMNMKDWQVVAEGVAMLQEAELSIRPLYHLVYKEGKDRPVV